jgi:hypothetical protein
VTRKGHPLAGKTGRILAHRAILYDRIGAGSHPCHWCGRSVSWQVQIGWGVDDLVSDHLDHDPQNNDPTNLVPSCGPCNVLRGLIFHWEARNQRPITDLRH